MGTPVPRQALIICPVCFEKGTVMGYADTKARGVAEIRNAVAWRFGRAPRDYMQRVPCPVCDGVGAIEQEGEPGPDEYMALRVYGQYKDGHLPTPGGMMDQSTAFLDAIAHIGNLAGKVQYDEYLKAKAESEKIKNRGGRR